MEMSRNETFVMHRWRLNDVNLGVGFVACDRVLDRMTVLKMCFVASGHIIAINTISVEVMIK